MRNIIATLFSLLALAGAAGASDLDAIKERGTLRVAVAGLTPFVIKHGEGEFSGFEIEATTALAAHLGVEIEFVEKPFCELATAIIEDEADIIASGYSNTAKRRRILDFTLPYHDTKYFAVVERRTAKAAKSLRGLNRKDIAMGYQEGGVSGDVATGNFSGADLRPFSSFAEIVDALKAGEVDGAVMFSPYQEILRKNKEPKFVVPHEFALMRTIEAYAMEQGAEALRDEINGWIIARDLEGYWDDLREKWFDLDNVEIGKRPIHDCPALEPTG